MAGITRPRASVDRVTETNDLLPAFRGIHQFADGFENSFDLMVVGLNSSFQILDLPGKLLVGRDQLAQPRERPHDLNQC